MRQRIKKQGSHSSDNEYDIEFINKNLDQLLLCFETIMEFMRFQCMLIDPYLIAIDDFFE